MLTCYAFSQVPPGAEGFVRDLRVRWALEEAEIPYRMQLVGTGPGDVTPSEYLSIQPFGQVPAIRDGELTLFESGAILLYLGDRSPRLLPRQQPERAHVQQWMVAALNTIEMPVWELAMIDAAYSDEAWAKERRPGAADAVRRRFAELAARMGDREYLVGAFSAADILLSTVLRFLMHTTLVEEQPRLAAYRARCEARPAFEAALAGQLEDLGKES
jgi:glutathione S-transferase